MSKKSEFIEYLEAVINEADMSENVLSYWKAFKVKTEVEKPMFTDNGKLVMNYLQSLSNPIPLKAKDIAEAIDVSSRTVSGAMRKLVGDGFVEKVGQDPVLYAITETGKDIEIN